MFLKIKTDLRVHDVVKYFHNVDNWTIKYEFDSVNYGEGYDLQYKSLPVRLYDDVRSDEVMLHPDFRPGSNWDEVFKIIVNRFKGNSFLYIEMDRHGIHDNNLIEEARNSISFIMQNHGLNVENE